jgi:FG-GAP repeat
MKSPHRFSSPLFFAVLVAVAVTSSLARAATIAQQAYLKASNTGTGDAFGWSVALSGDTLVVGAYQEDSNAIGVNGNQTNNSLTRAGAAYVFVREGTNWIQQAYLKASNTSNTVEGAGFGWSVAVSGDTLAVAAVAESSNATGVNGNQSDTSAFASGAVYIFVRSGTNWSQQAYLKASNTGGRPPGQPYGDLFGHALSLSGDTLVVGAFQEDSNATGVNGNQTNDNAPDSGAAYVVVRSGTNWTQQAYLKASNTGAGDRFGISVAVSGETLVVGSWTEGSSATGVNGNQSDNSAGGAGAAYVFVREGTNWTQQAYLKPSNTGAGDSFGRVVAISGNTIAAGAYQEDSNATGVGGNQTDNSFGDSGAVYVFARNGTNWSQQAYLKASNTGASDWFGYAVSLSGDTMVVGAAGFYLFVEGGGNGEDSNATGVNGDRTNNSAAESGAAYVFVRAGTTWSQQAYLKASNTGAGDYFGKFVAVSGGTVAVGAPAESSNATGVGGDQSNNSASQSGAAYVFTGLGNGPRVALLPSDTGSHLLRFNGSPEITYRLQRAPSVTGPWETIDTQTAPSSGLIEYHDVNPLPGQAFYRTAQP